MATGADRISALIIKHLNKGLDEAERVELQEWMDQSVINRQVVEEFLAEDKLREGIINLYSTKEKIWQRLDKQIPGLDEQVPDQKPAPAIPFGRPFWKYTAAAVILILLTGAIYLLLNKGAGPKQDKLAGQSERFKNDVAPGSNRATLTLASGRTIILDSVQNGSLARQGSARILKLTNGQLVYSPSGQQTGETLYNTISTPRGGQYHIVLTDGTGVWLNAASSIKFPASFTGKERRVTITGEAYFEVAKNAAMPFVVSTEKDAEVQVLGTHFNVNAYSDEASMNTTLLEGSVQVKQGNAMDLLRPGQRAELSKDGKIRLVNDADTEEAVAWKNGNFQFQNDGIGTIMRQICRWYDVKIIYEGKIPAGTYSGGVSRNTKISNVLKILELSDLHFRIEGNTLTVLP